MQCVSVLQPILTVIALVQAPQLVKFMLMHTGIHAQQHQTQVLALRVAPLGHWEAIMVRVVSVLIKTGIFQNFPAFGGLAYSSPLF